MSKNKRYGGGIGFSKNNKVLPATGSPVSEKQDSQMPAHSRTSVLPFLPSNSDVSNRMEAAREKTVDTYNQKAINAATHLTGIKKEIQNTNFITQSLPTSLKHFLLREDTMELWRALHGHNAIVNIIPTIQYASQNGEKIIIMFTLRFIFGKTENYNQSTVTMSYGEGTNIIYGPKPFVNGDDFKDIISACVNHAGTVFGELCNISDPKTTLYIPIDVDMLYKSSLTLQRPNIKYILDVVEVDEYLFDNVLFDDGIFEDLRLDDIVNEINNPTQIDPQIITDIQKADVIPKGFEDSVHRVEDIPNLLNIHGKDNGKVVLVYSLRNQGGRPRATKMRLVGKRNVGARERNVYKGNGNKLYVKSKNEFIGLREFKSTSKL